jgi:hypothetical protein
MKTRVLTIALTTLSVVFNVNSQPMAGSSPSAIPLHSRVFVSGTTYNGNLGGISGANAKCNALANASSIPGLWRAWISADGITPDGTFTRFEGNYRRMDRTLIAVGWDELISGMLRAPITISQTGSTATGPVWTNTTASGTAAPTSGCQGFTSSTFVNFSVVGIAGGVGPEWTESPNLSSCDTPRRIYCFDEPMPESATISGRVTYPSNGPSFGERGSGRAKVTLTGPRLAAPVVVYTNKYGKFAFTGLETGTTYTVNVMGSSRFPFGFFPNNQTFNLRGDVTANFSYVGD